jgi:hypothetical protein
MKAWVGIDPGSKGVIAVLYENDEVEYIFLKNAIDISGFMRKIAQEHQIVDVCIENVHSIYGVSAKSNFSFGFNTGWVHGIIEPLGVKISAVTPKVWQNYLGVTTHGKLIKKNVAELIQKLYPSVNLYTTRNSLKDGISDALAIAHYSRYNNYATQD